ncbi:MAG TPA: hypothetical protein VL326_06335 [Kofleriaceae bacterium]|jgi:hypothetical protein|nr:hypothetical protein [Kofleriaceae bacterium]
MNNEITTIAAADLEDVTGGFAWLAKAATMLGGMFGGGTNLNAQIGNNQRSANGNSGPVSIGDGSPINVNPPASGPTGGQ